MKTKKDFTLSVDKVLSIMYRIISITTCLFVVASFAVSCFGEPIRSKADYVIDDYFPNWYWDYLDSSTREFWTIEQNRQQLIKPQVQDANADSNLTQTEKQEINEVDTLQQVFFNTWLNIYNNLALNNFENIPDSYTVSGSGGLAYYKRVQNGVIYPVHLFTGRFGDILAESEDFKLSITVTNQNFNQSCVPFYSSDSKTYGFKWTGDTVYTEFVWRDSLGYFNNDARTNNRFNGDVYGFSCSNLTIPVMSRGTSAYFVYFGQGTNITLPSGTVPNPWTYYNTVLLPYMKQTYTTVNNNYYLFPDGYSAPINLPDLSFDPTVIAPPIVAGAGAIIVAGNASFDIFAPISICPQFSVDGITFQFPTGGDNVYIDSLPYNIPSSGITFGDKIIDIIDKGKVIIDGVQFLLDGDDLTIDDITFNLPIGSPNIVPSEAYDYEYLIPTETLADIRLPDTSLPLNADLPIAVSSTLPALWDTIYDVLNNSGLWSIFPWLFGLSCCLYIVHKLGN